MPKKEKKKNRKAQKFNFFFFLCLRECGMHKRDERRRENKRKKKGSIGGDNRKSTSLYSTSTSLHSEATSNYRGGSRQPLIDTLSRALAKISVNSWDGIRENCYPKLKRCATIYSPDSLQQMSELSICIASSIAGISTSLSCHSLGLVYNFQLHQLFISCACQSGETSAKEKSNEIKKKRLYI